MVTVNTPLGYIQLRDGDTVTLQATATDSTGVKRLELWVDGRDVRTDTVPVPQPIVSMEEAGQASTGPHVITVRAYNVAEVASDDVSISVAVILSPQPAPRSPATADLPATAQLFPDKGHKK